MPRSEDSKDPYHFKLAIYRISEFRRVERFPFLLLPLLLAMGASFVQIIIIYTDVQCLRTKGNSVLSPGNAVFLF